MTAHYRRADGDLGPDHQVPDSAERNEKGPFHADNDEDDQGDTTESDDPDNDAMIYHDNMVTDAELASALQATSARKGVYMSTSGASGRDAPTPKHKKKLPFGTPSVFS